jgi:uncharacterized protein YjbJ (UPF0337 family)
MENPPELKGNWNETKIKLKQKFAMLTDNDVKLADGKESPILGRLQFKLNKTEAEIYKIINEL